MRKCQHKTIKAIRAVKILRKDALNQQDVERFIHEIEILKTLVSFIYFKLFIGSSKYFKAF